ncbi:MAG: plasmid stabilization protein [Phyllobacteriaceae bacterium]|nr:plasmid stabilization protein [Phyllobacteriaceae bacterium]
MATLTIRNVPEHVRQALRVQAARNGLSMEEALRRLIVQTATDREPRRSTISAEEILRRADRVYQQEPLDGRYQYFAHKELSDAICGEFEDL